VATLTSQSLHLADLLGRPPAPGATTAPTPGAATPPVPPAAADGGAAAGAAVEGAGPPDAETARLVPDWPIPVARLQRLELELQLNGERVTLGRSELHGVALQARLRQGRLEINAQAAEMWGGALAASLRLDANEAPPLAALSLSLRGLDYTKTFAALGVSGFRTGRAEVALRLRGQGATLREALAAADGDAELFGSEGRIDSRFLKLWASDLLLALVPTFGDKKDGEVRCAVARFDVAKGKAETRSILLDVEHVIVKGVGTVQLGDESLDLLLWPEPRDASLISVTTPMRVTGTLAHPSVSPQPRGVVEDVAWLLIGAHNPFVLLLGIIKPSTVEQQPCVAALAGGDGPGKQEQNRPPNPLNKTQDFFRGLGRFLERSFGGD
jgi:AsmA family protein